MRKKYLDNIRWSIILLVLLVHTVCIYSACKAPMSYNSEGIAILDAIGYMIYPWFMPCLFVVAGMSAKYALEKKTPKAFLKGRFKKLMIPFLAYLLLIGPFASTLSFKVNHLEEVFAKLPKAIVVLIRIVSGMGPSWFLFQLMLVVLVFMVILKIDKKQKLVEWGKKCNLVGLVLLYIPVLISAQLLYVTLTFRNVLYLFLFLLGYYVFSEESMQELCKKIALPCLGAGLVVGGIQTYLYWGKPYQEIVNHWEVVLFTWLMILAVLGCYGKYFDAQNKVSDYMSQNGFGVYLFHYVPMVYIAYAMDTYFILPYIANYLVTFIGTLIVSIGLTECVKRIPVIGTIFGLRK